jgi:hypothetical protein
MGEGGPFSLWEKMAPLQRAPWMSLDCLRHRKRFENAALGSIEARCESIPVGPARFSFLLLGRSPKERPSFC